MRIQWTLIFALIFALIIALFAVFNVETVPVNFIVGVRSLPLILIILGSTLLGGLIIGLFGIVLQYRLQRKVKQLQKELEQFKQAAQTETEENPQTPQDQANVGEKANTAGDPTDAEISKTTDGNGTL